MLLAVQRICFRGIKKAPSASTQKPTRHPKYLIRKAEFLSRRREIAVEVALFCGWRLEFSAPYGQFSVGLSGKSGVRIQIPAFPHKIPDAQK
jgi:hypothetical protein